MEKIEKLVKQISWDYANKPVVGKINEIIDRLNEQLEEDVRDGLLAEELDFEREMDTTEEWEDWEGDLFWKITHIFEPADIVRYVTKLLEEREREVLEEVLGAEVRHNSHSIFSDGWARRVTERVVDKLDKLNKEE